MDQLQLGMEKAHYMLAAVLGGKIPSLNTGIPRPPFLPRYLARYPSCHLASNCCRAHCCTWCC